MFSQVLGLFTQDLAVDLGSSRTRIHARGVGLLCDEPSIVAVLVLPDGRRRVLAVGDEALPMLGRTPDDILAIQPIRDGHIEDVDVAEALLIQLVRRHLGRTGFLGPRMALALPPGTSAASTGALREAARTAGAREVQILSRPLAAAMGAGLPIDQPDGHLVVDLGGGSTDVSVTSLGQLVHHETSPGGESIDDAIVAWVKRHHAIAIGRPTAEFLKCTLGTAIRGGSSGSQTVKGRCLRLGIPRAVTIQADDLEAAVAPFVNHLAGVLCRAMETLPPEISSDICNSGVVLTGGGGDLDSLDAALRHLTGLPVVVADDPSNAVARGIAGTLGQPDLAAAIGA